MKKPIFSFFLASLAASAMAQGWPAEYDGVMLQGFYWDSFSDSKWHKLEAQADELSASFSLVWIPQSGNCSGTSMGYNPKYYWDQNSSFGSEAELRSMISTFKAKGLGTIADVVINHRQNLSNWVDFPAETYKGVTYQMLSTDIVADDDGGETKRWADQNGYQLSSNKDSGEGWSGMRDLDHASENVQKSIFAYEDYLLNDLGYAGFRYDVGKGFAAKYFGIYNDKAKPQFSVGEVWDNNQTIQNWINGTKVDDVIQSAAFDFQNRYQMRDAVNNGKWNTLGGSNNLIKGTAFRRYSVTFVENHDTELRSNGEQQDPIRKDTLACNAFMLATPGTPCVFFKHWQAYKPEIKLMIQARKAAGIHNQSNYLNLATADAYYAFRTDGSVCNLIGVVGTGANAYTPNAANENYVLILEGHHYKYYLQRTAETPWVSIASATFAEGETIRPVLTAVSAADGAQLVYTTDGSTPTATNGTKVQSGHTLTVSQTTTLKVGLLVGGVVTKIVTYTYGFQSPEQYESFPLTVYVRSEVASFNNKMNFYIWAGEDNTQLNGGWPGKQITETVQHDGFTWFTQTHQITSASLLPVNLVFSTGSGSPQTVDVTGITSDSWFVIRNSQSGGKHLVEDVTSSYSSAIDAVESLRDTDADVTFDLQGRRVQSMEPGRIYVRDGKRILLNSR